MNALLMILAGIALLGGLACTVFILIEMFRDELWKGFLGILCGLYLIYFALFDWDHEWKWPIFLGSIGGNGIAAGIMSLAQGG